MTFARGGKDVRVPAGFGSGKAPAATDASDPPARQELPSLAMLATDEVDPGTVVLTCANCGAEMDERKCKLICRCGYFLSCSDYY